MKINKRKTYDIHKTRTESLILASACEWSVKYGYDSEDFLKKLMTSDWGIHVMNGDYHAEWVDALFLLFGFKHFVGLVKGKIYSEIQMEFIGYLYKYWVDSRNMSSVDVYRIAPPSKLIRHYSFLSTQECEYIIENLTDEYNSSLPERR